MEYGWFRPYVPIHVRRAQALRALPGLLGKGKTAAPVQGQGKAIAASVWGREWCRNLERYSDYATRLPRGRTYVRNGSVVHLDVRAGEALAYVSGSELYTVKVRVKAVPATRWRALRADCVRSIASLVELLRGDLDAQVMERVCREGAGLFPTPKEIAFDCSCLDWASMCKHVAAVLYGIGVRFDDDPEILFRLRQVSAAELVAGAGRGLALGGRGPVASKILADDQVVEVFGVQLGDIAPPSSALGGRAFRKGASAAGKGLSAGGARTEQAACGRGATAGGGGSARAADARPASARTVRGASVRRTPKQRLRPR
jgi:hypothetical protein